MSIFRAKTSSIKTPEKYQSIMANQLGTPTITAVTLNFSSASVAFTQTGDTTTTYTVVSTPGNYSATGTSSPVVVSGLAASTTYTFVVTGYQVDKGTLSAPSIPSSPVTTPALPVVSGGTLTSDSTYYYRTFTGNDTLTVSNNTLIADLVLVSGGGSGSGARNTYSSGTYKGRPYRCSQSYYSGGGGGGGVRSLSSVSFSPNSYSVTVGAGGASASGAKGSNGNPSSLNGYSSTGGGSGAYGDPSAGSSGGSGGGGGLRIYNTICCSYTYTSSYGSGNAGGYSPPEGYQGGSIVAASGNVFTGATGGGAGGAAVNAGASIGAYSSASYGGPGASSWKGTFGGGGAAPAISNGNGSYGGSGGGGSTGGAGGTNTGGGGGGVQPSGQNTSIVGGSGGSGLVAIRYTRAQVGG